MTERALAGSPAEPVEAPDAILDRSSGSLETVWENELGGLTFRDRSAARYLKWVAAGTPEFDLDAEAARLVWAAEQGARVPRVIESGSDPSGSWLITAALPGHSAVAPRWIAEPETAARAIGAGLRDLHDRLDASTCPYDWSIEQRLVQVEERLTRGTGPAEWAPEHRALTIREARDLLRSAPPVDGPVVCHGDACAPNTLLDETGAFLAHVDLGALGTADRWADLAIASWSTVWNFGPGYEDAVYAGYGVDPDPERIAYYRLLWDLS